MRSAKSSIGHAPVVMKWFGATSVSTSLKPWAYSSSKSPTISSKISPIVTKPDVPPCSSTTKAIFVFSRLSTLSSFTTGMPSGTATMRRTRTSSMVLSGDKLYKSFTLTKPTISSLSRRYTGKRVNFASVTMRMFSSNVSLMHRHTMSGRGVMSDSASLSAMSKILSTNSFCSGAIRPLSVDSSMSSLISSSVYTSCSLAGSWPAMRTTALVMPLNSTIMG